MNRAAVVRWKARLLIRQGLLDHAQGNLDLALHRAAPLAELDHLRRLRDKRRGQVAFAERVIANNTVMRISSKGLRFIKLFEGFPNGGRPYRDPVGVWTIGYGHIEGVGPHTKRLTQRQADRLLRRDLRERYEPALRQTQIPFTQYEWDALVSFVYNLGVGILAPERTIGHALRRGSKRQAADALLLYDKAGGRTLPGLTRRRRAERRLFLTGVHPLG